MSDPVLPPEILDYILDLLHDDLKSLKPCSLVAKSWVPRTRRYLFAHIRFYAARIPVSWSNTFPDPTNSPAPHVRTLEFYYPEDLEGADWIRTFSCVVTLRLGGHPTVPFALFHGFSHNLKSLKIRSTQFSCSELFKFICSFPLLENLDLVSEKVLEDDENDLHGLQTSPPLTGSLKLTVSDGGMRSTPRHFLNLPNGLRFRELVFFLNVECDLRWIRELVLRCSDTLECLDIKYRLSTIPGFIDLSQVTKLKVLKVQLTSLSRRLGIGRLIAMLDTITAEHQDFRQISLDVPDIFNPQLYGDDTYERWSGLDRLLVRLWESHSIRTEVVVAWCDKEMKGQVGTLLPEITARGIVDIFEDY